MQLSEQGFDKVGGRLHCASINQSINQSSRPIA